MSVAAVGRLSRSASRAVAKAANGFHLFRIEGYSLANKVLPGQKISSQGFTVGDYSWRVDYYPNGRDTSTKSNTISVYLQLTDHTHRLLEARYKFSLLDHAGNAGYELPADTGSFTSLSRAAVDDQGPGCGHEEFIGREELERRREDLIRDDRVVLRCDVGVTQIVDGWRLAGDELSEEEEDEQQYRYVAPGYGFGGPPRHRLRQRRTDDDEYVKWCLTQEPSESRGYRQGRARHFGHHDWY